MSQPWLRAPEVPLPRDWRDRCVAHAALPGDLTAPPGVPAWVFLQWLADERGVLLHGTGDARIERFEPRTPNDKSPDDFSKRTAVFASSDAIWALFYAVALNYPGRNMLNMAVQDAVGAGWGAMRYFFSLSHGPAVPFRAGHVHLLPREGFERMPPYDWPGVGRVLEPQWASAAPARSVGRLAVSPADFPLLASVRRHDNAAVQRRAQADPWGFPWRADLLG